MGGGMEVEGLIADKIDCALLWLAWQSTTDIERVLCYACFHVKC